MKRELREKEKVSKEKQLTQNEKKTAAAAGVLLFYAEKAFPESSSLLRERQTKFQIGLNLIHRNFFQRLCKEFNSIQ